MPVANVEELFGRLPDAAAREELTENYRPFAYHLARRYKDRGESLADLRQVALIGLLNAIDRFDTNHGVSFTSFAAPTISGELKRHFRDNVWGIGVPRRLKELAVAYRKADLQLLQMLGRRPSPTEVAAHVGMTEDDALAVIAINNGYRPDSMDAPVRTTDRAISDLLEVEDDAIGLFDEMEAVRSITASMSELRREILSLRFGEEMTQRRIANKVGVSQMTVSRLLQTSIETIRLNMAR